MKLGNKHEEDLKGMAPPRKASRPKIKNRRMAMAPAIVLVCALCTIVSVIICISRSQEIYGGVTKTAIYKGYISRYENRLYPIVEIDGQEYISSLRQDVRDASYVGNAVTIVVDESDPRNFRVQWDSQPGIE